ncbi:MAG TPA: hypothetical protein VGP93_20430, partial [Polyangiaceae bacterium]|nr:hypothetical protein [Polyangiaceae bacterium]
MQSGGSANAAGSAATSANSAGGTTTSSTGGSSTVPSGGATNAAGGSAGSSGSMPYVPPTCDDAPTWPSDAPVLDTETWTNIAPIPNFYSNGLAFNPCNPAVLYTVGGNYPASGGSGDDTGLYRSTNAGKSWGKVLEID